MNRYGGKEGTMECINCGNCKQNQPTYYCFAKEQIVINNGYIPDLKEERSGWKKGNPKYETHRRKQKKSEAEI